MDFHRNELQILDKALKIMAQGFADLPDTSPSENRMEEAEKVLEEVGKRMQDNYPYFHPLYAGQMIKPPHSIARLAYMLALYINPNNHALDGGRASSRMEKETVAAIAKMFGWDVHLGHLCGGGTLANMEALWVASSLNEGKLVVASEQAHYTHQRLSHVLKIPYQSVPVDGKARMDLHALEDLLKTGQVGTVVATIGTTATGSVDPLEDILMLRERYPFRLHADAAYGGYFILAENLDKETSRAYQHIKEVDSIAIDPHKHGLQPYGCGCILFKDPAVGKLYKHDSPYTYFSSEELHLGEISLECSRAGASAVALWATQRLFPMERGGDFAKSLEMCHDAALSLYNKLVSDQRFVTAFSPELDIVIYAPRADRVTEISERSRRFFDLAAERNLHLALATLPVSFFAPSLEGIEKDADTIVCLRSCLMKPEQRAWIERIYQLLGEISREL